jgi:hypothetical protein
VLQVFLQLAFCYQDGGCVTTVFTIDKFECLGGELRTLIFSLRANRGIVVSDA